MYIHVYYVSVYKCGARRVQHVVLLPLDLSPAGIAARVRRQTHIIYKVYLSLSLYIYI